MELSTLKRCYGRRERPLLPCYKKMYAILCGAASEAIDILQETQDPEGAAALLKKALWDAEELYISGEESSTEDPAI